MKNILSNTKNQLIILLLLAFGLNCNSLYNEYAVDDIVVLTGNTSVQKGIKGIPEILSTDFFYGLEKKESGLSGGRYRPFALVIFALEYQFFGANPMISHLINVLLFIILIASLYKLLRNHIFREQHPYLAFITCLLFVVHPIHTEVIANVKSRDELIAFIFLIGAAFAFIKYTQQRSIISFLAGLLCFMFALLTRESAVPFIGIVPLVAYFFYYQSVKKAMLFSIPLMVIFLIYMALRISVVGFSYTTSSDILNAPFLYASPTEAFATKTFILLKYIGLLAFPHPLCSDYGFNQLKYVDVNSVPFILSSLVLISLLICALITVKRRSIISFSILYFFITIFLFSNFVLDIGAPLAERLLFQPSLAFCFVFANLYLKAKSKNIFITESILITVLLFFSIKTISRNQEWKNDLTLYSADAITAPESVRANQHLGHKLLEKAITEPDMELKEKDLKKAIFHHEKVLKIYPHQRIIYDDLGTEYLELRDYFKSADYYLNCYNAEPRNLDAKKKVDMLSDLLFSEGIENYNSGKIEDAIKCYYKAVELNVNNVE
ncbi:MAG: hypothetical protein NTX97_11915, partial [Bacteroidetes bacterium]|nr:hypothetical protein [Bacteroidota bacterium]